ncbi:MAG TPA: nucleotidyltransferase family protein [Terriglobales bacterium]|nr:nucleotidyltransferase family protein [Terriglobales bacterium]
MLAVLLAAGRGTRMGELTRNTPKPLLPLQGRPILEHILLGLREAAIDRAVIVTGYLGEQIERYFGDGGALGLRVDYARQITTDGTAKALLLAREHIDGPFLLSWGDILVDRSLYGALAAQFEARPCDLLLSVNAVDDPWRGGAVYFDAERRVTALIEKPPQGTSSTNWNNAGVFVCSPVVLEYAERLAPSPRGEFELPQAIQAMIADGRDVRGYPITGYWSDLGTPEDLQAAEASYSAGDLSGRGAA